MSIIHLYNTNKMTFCCPKDKKLEPRRGFCVHKVIDHVIFLEAGAVMNVESSKGIKIWECKECNRSVDDADSVAFHLVNGILYGWCRRCYESAMVRRAQGNYEQAA